MLIAPSTRSRKVGALFAATAVLATGMAWILHPALSVGSTKPRPWDEGTGTGAAAARAAAEVGTPSAEVTARVRRVSMASELTYQDASLRQRMILEGASTYGSKPAAAAASTAPAMLALEQAAYAAAGGGQLAAPGQDWNMPPLLRSI